MFIILIVISLATITSAIVVNSTQYAFVQQFVSQSRFNASAFNASDCPMQIVPESVQIACDSRGRITQLHFYNLSIVAVMNASFSLLSDLTYLNLSRNHLVGSIQPLTALTNLQTLDISHNVFVQREDAIGLIERLPALVSCCLQLPYPGDTNCFLGEIWPNATLCSNPTQNPLYLCDTPIPRTTTTIVTTTTTITTISITPTTSSIVKNTTLLGTSVSPSNATTAIISTTAQLADTSTVATSTVLSSLFTTQAKTATSTSTIESTAKTTPRTNNTGSPTATKSLQIQNHLDTVLMLTSISLGVAFVLVVAYVVGSKLKKRNAKRGGANRPNDRELVSDADTEESVEMDEIEARSLPEPASNYDKLPPPAFNQNHRDDEEKSYDAVHMVNSSNYDRVGIARRVPVYDRVDSEKTVYDKAESPLVV